MSLPVEVFQIFFWQWLTASETSLLKLLEFVYVSTGCQLKLNQETSKDLKTKNDTNDRNWFSHRKGKIIQPLTQEEVAAPGRRTLSCPPWHWRRCHSPAWRDMNISHCALSLSGHKASLNSSSLRHSSCPRWRSEEAAGCHCWACSPQERWPSSTCGSPHCRRCPAGCSPLWGPPGSRPHLAASSWSEKRRRLDKLVLVIQLLLFPLGVSAGCLNDPWTVKMHQKLLLECSV